MQLKIILSRPMANRINKQDQIKRSSCPMSCALDMIGDKWTLLVIRDIMFLEKRYFRDFLSSPEKIASNILADRLRKLEESHIVLRQGDPDNARRFIYSLTEKGLDLLPTMMELLRWGEKYDPASEGHECSIRQFAHHPHGSG
ncbi:winged helix-turn-helix transcriptional regulator [Nitrosovibrio tenuis]|uniref:Transcriptional regulator, HxlR family n=1 Tax=Nitrosovibrio tenuis TaxID=1233 RepID=A0A1H7J1J8_9PROT|nr:helix-turn-helix domain-containing protein [Nitrosovibrio tenuis]SEK66955.1 transcriptional regulator, HxlR family [Nitrosovibrio tenuis]